MASFADWLINNIDRASWWRAKACEKYPGDCANEGGVDIPLPHGTPIYAIAGGKLMGAGTFVHKNGVPGYGVVTIDVPGIGQVYYQHIDIDPSIPHCENGNCNNVVIQTGQLIGKTRQDVYGLEVGINPTWGGIWGTNRDNSLWVADPRSELKDLARVTSTVTPPGPGLSPLQDCTTVCAPYNGTVVYPFCIAWCNGTQQIGGVVSGPINSITQGLADVDAVFKFLTDRKNWLRIAKALLGIVLIGAALVLAVLVIMGKLETNDTVKGAVKAAEVAAV